MSANSAVRREPGSGDVDRDRQRFDEYRVGEHEHIMELEDPALEELGKLVSDDGVSGRRSWQEMARHLGQGDAIAEIQESGARNPGYEVLKRWRAAGEKSTVFVLREVLRHIRRHDVASRELNKYLLNEVLVTVVLMSDGHEECNLSGTCPGRMPIIEFIRPKIYRKMAPEMIGKHRFVIRMHRHDVTWSSPAILFRGQELTLEKITTPPPGTRQERSEIACRRRSSVERFDRDVISWIDGDVIYFDTDSTDSKNTDDSVKVKVSGGIGSSATEKVAQEHDEETEIDCAGKDSHVIQPEATTTKNGQDVNSSGLCSSMLLDSDGPSRVDAPPELQDLSEDLGSFLLKEDGELSSTADC